MAIEQHNNFLNKKFTIIDIFLFIELWSLDDITEAEGWGGRRVFVLPANTSGAESLHRCDSGGEAMKRRGRRIEFLA